MVAGAPDPGPPDPGPPTWSYLGGCSYLSDWRPNVLTQPFIEHAVSYTLFFFVPTE